MPRSKRSYSGPSNRVVRRRVSRPSPSSYPSPPYSPNWQRNRFGAAIFNSIATPGTPMNRMLQRAASSAGEYAARGVRNGLNYLSNGQRPPFRLPPSATNTAVRNRRNYYPMNSSSTIVGRLSKFRRKRKTFREVCESRGFSCSFEIGGSVTDPYCCYIGHATCPLVLVRRLFFGSLLKLLFVKMQLNPSDMDMPITGISIGDQINILYLNSYSLSSNLNTMTWTAAVAQPTMKTILNEVINVWVLAVQGSLPTNPREYKLKEMRFNPAGADDLQACKINLESAYFNFEVVSTLKVQNRSVPSPTENEDDEVDRIPVIGKGYYGRGTGTSYRRTALPALGEPIFEPIVNENNGVYTFSAGTAGAPTTIREPPPRMHFPRVGKMGSLSLDPGKVKFSKLVFRKHISIANFLTLLIGVDERAASPNVGMGSIGKFALYALEKVLETSNTTPTQLINIGYEHDYKIYGYVNAGRTNYTIGEVYTGTNPA